MTAAMEQHVWLPFPLSAEHLTTPEKRADAVARTLRSITDYATQLGEVREGDMPRMLNTIATVGRLEADKYGASTIVDGLVERFRATLTYATEEAAVSACEEAVWERATAGLPVGSEIGAFGVSRDEFRQGVLAFIGWDAEGASS